MKIKKHLWKFGLGAIAIAIPTIALTSCSTNSPTKTFAELVVSDDTSTLKDKSFSESAYNGWRNFMISENVTNQFGTPDTYTKEVLDMPEINSGSKDLDLAKGYWRRPSSNRENTFRQIFNGGANLIIAPGFSHKEAVEKVANENKEKGFILLDSNVDSTKGDFTNVASFTFRAEQSGFLAGIATAEFLNANKEIFTTGQGDDGKLKVGGFVGNAFPSTTDFLAGFQHGIIAYNLNRNANGNTKTEVEWISLGQDITNYESGSFSPGAGADISNNLIKLGADAIIPIAGPQTTDAMSASLAQNRPVIVVGVDSEQEKIQEIQKQLTDKQMNGKELKNASGQPLGNRNVLQFSAIKKVDEAVYQTLVAIFNEANPNNTTVADANNQPVQGFGYNNYGTLINKTVGVSEAGLEWVNLFNDSWVDPEGSGNVFNVEGGIYQNDVFKNLETVGALYNDTLTGLNNISDLTNKTKTKSTLFNNNGVVSPLPANTQAIAPSLNKKAGSESLNGSVWSLKKGELKKTPESTEPKKYKI